MEWEPFNSWNWQVQPQGVAKGAKIKTMSLWLSQSYTSVSTSLLPAPPFLPATYKCLSDQKIQVFVVAQEGGFLVLRL